MEWVTVYDHDKECHLTFGRGVYIVEYDTQSNVLNFKNINIFIIEDSVLNQFDNIPLITLWHMSNTSYG